MVCITLTASYLRALKEWATERVKLTRNEWLYILFSDESSFSVHPDNKLIFIWRECGTRNNPVFVQENVRLRIEGVMVYAEIFINGRTILRIIRNSFE